ncbi:hypothetical protein B0T16DRAFT_354465, partial [Cercophora newfieldiana]
MHRSNCWQQASTTSASSLESWSQSGQATWLSTPRRFRSGYPLSPPLLLSTRVNLHPLASSSIGNCLNSGHEGTPDPRILLCVSSVGPRKIVRPKATPDNMEVADLELIEVNVFDETDSCVLRLWQDKIPSAKAWIPSQTILLITNPRCRPADKKHPTPELSLGITSMVEVDPSFPEAHWLRKMAMNRTKKESVYIPFPEDLWDAETAMNGPDRTAFTLADIDELARESPTRIFTGTLNVMILGVKIAENSRKTQLCCTECCGFPLYANRPQATCKNCLGERTLALNPRIVGPLADESGCIAAGKLIWSEKAWTELLFGTGSYIKEGDSGYAGCSWKGLTALDSNALRSVEEQLQYSRITLVFGWSPEVGRLSVL